MRIGQDADLVVVAPATADLLARAAHGLADDLLTNTLLTARCPVVLAPAMHTEMWLHPATQANVATLRGRGVVVLDPASGRLTGADTGPGRLPEPDEIFACRAARRWPARHAEPGDLRRPRRRRVSAGGTREHLDPVRFLGNRSSGRQGYALAATALGPRRRGHRWSSANVRPARPGRRQGRPGGVGRRPAGGRARGRRRRRRGRDGRRGRRLPAARRRSSTKIKKAAGGSPTGSLSSATRDILAELAAATAGPATARSWSASPPRPATPRATCWRTAGPSSPARAATCSS